MKWNHRILAHQSPNGEVYLHIHEVYYDGNNEPKGYTENPISVGGETVREITWVLNRIKDCRKKPILWAGEKFPSEYVPRKNKARSGDYWCHNYFTVWRTSSKEKSWRHVFISFGIRRSDIWQLFPIWLTGNNCQKSVMFGIGKLYFEIGYRY